MEQSTVIILWCRTCIDVQISLQDPLGCKTHHKLKRFIVLNRIWMYRWSNQDLSWSMSSPWIRLCCRDRRRRGRASSCAAPTMSDGHGRGYAICPRRAKVDWGQLRASSQNSCSGWTWPMRAPSKDRMPWCTGQDLYNIQSKCIEGATANSPSPALKSW